MKKRYLVLIVLILLFIPVTYTFAADQEADAPDMMLITGIIAIGALIFIGIVAAGILKKDQGTDRMKEISKLIQVGAMAYIKQQYLVIGIFLAVLFVIFFIMSFVLNMIHRVVPFAFLTGGLFSGLTGFIGMFISTRSNARTAWAAKSSLNAGLRVAFNSGTVMGMAVVSLGCLNIAFYWFILSVLGVAVRDIPSIMITFSMGASSVALFARLGGGIFTKAADVGADLVGKVEAGIPEDDPRNPATIADNVGDNVGDVAGMGADLYESYVGSIIATMVLGAVAFQHIPGVSLINAIQIPVIISAIGIVCSIIGTFLVRTKEGASQSVLLRSLRIGVYTAAGLIAVISFILVYYLLGLEYIGIWLAMLVGLLTGIIIGYFTEYYTSADYKPTKKLANQTQTGAATLIIGGLALGMSSTFIPVITVVIAILAAYFFAGQGGMGLYGIGMASVGMLSTLGITLATDAYGPVADNAGGIAEMAGLDPEVRKRTDALDSLGNTTAATGKGFAIGSAALTALTLLAAYGNNILEFLKKIAADGSITITQGFKNFCTGIFNFDEWVAGGAVVDIFNIKIDLFNPVILVSLFIGTALPFVFASLSMSAVGRAAGDMVKEVRRQFKEKKGILTGTEKPDYAACIAISTKGAQREMILPSLIALIAPISIGILLGPFAVIALLAGSLASGFVLAIMMANSGGAWDNAKKYIEGGELGGKGSDAHKAAVVGDTVGDPFKDTSGPSMNILIKLMSMVAIVFLSVFIAVNSFIMGIF